MAGESFYAVAVGRKVGIFSDWTTTESMVKGFPSAKHKKFKSRREADDYITTNSISKPVKTPNFQDNAEPAAESRSNLHMKRTFQNEDCPRRT
jgi:ribonuclease HI